MHQVSVVISSSLCFALLHWIYKWEKGQL